MREGDDGVYFLHGGWLVMLDGEFMGAVWNSKGAAEAGLEVERRRRKEERL